MLRKKNYKEEEHFTRYYSVSIPRNNGSKLTIYYKRYRPASTPKSLYEELQRRGPSENNAKELYPSDRTLEVMSFDGKF